MSGNAFVSDQVLLDVSFGDARVRLNRFTGGGVLLGASEVAFGEGITGLAEEPGPAAGMCRLARVRPGNLAETGDRARLCLRWEAIGPDGATYPALDADLTLAPAGETTTLLTLAGVYRLPGQAAAGPDPAEVRCVGALIIRLFVARLACALVHPAGSAVLVRCAGQDSARRRPGQHRP